MPDSKRPSVAIIGTRGYPSFYGGFETLVRRLAPYLADQGWGVTVYGRAGSADDRNAACDPRVRRVQTPGIESKSLSTLSYGLTSSMHASKTRPDVALVMNVANGFWLPLLKQCGIPTLINVDGIEWERAKWGRAAKSAFMAGAALTAKYADRLVYDSAEIGRRWQERYGREGVYIPYGASEPLMTTFDDELVRRQYALMVARFVPENTVTEFFNAATRLSLRWDIAIVGSSGYGGPIDAQAKELADSNDRIKWFGHLNDDAKLFGLWQNAGAYFHGHSVGGTNPALVQAMACGAPTVARDTVYNREVLGDAGLFVEPRGGAIATAMDQVLCDTTLQSRLSAAVRVRQQHAYTWDLVCERYSSTLESMSSRKLTRTEQPI